ncbi:aminotransferase class I/II-fold pyridoxal phosphate-dependent enzyme [Paraburkholderia bonniea]|uniref:aminotransferase class I/II-fold pyridoxal phosphate-dependent enzyme n=1 Tax=Paraburkholderia bonniea TaxID=2152891 RepID=UPI001290D493|nr:aminotransferase class I/II-fold pyridoxal phosphate-dependent enzyme [Paraburkholderia bonniea]WJF90823.1 aminotransferase class I/II-fold pyridoxal phosphate-dependent enzyme [Paraburkholderia bonniea]WJF94137.1 aminotransferase class I/II-fold pyridoxal phosphate-dependent enzyme [Paraburkholderia bonniea]
MEFTAEQRQAFAARALQRQLERVSGATASASASAPIPQATEPDARCRFDTMPKYQQVALMRQMGQAFQVESPFFRVHEGMAGATTQIAGQTYLNYANYNYLGLASDPLVCERAHAALEQYGTSASASRMVAGERPVQRELEQALAAFYETADCVTLVSGHATNVTVIGALFGPGDLIVHDALAHNSIVQGAQLSGARRLSFAHNDWQALDALLHRVRGEYQRVLIAIEGLYSMDGDLPDLARFVEVKQRHAAFLLVDEAHSLGVLGATGRGLRELAQVPASAVDIWMGTLSKTLAGCGGFIAGSQPLIDILRHLAPGFLYSVGLAPVLAAASLAALERLQAEPQRVVTLRQRSQQFLHEARAAGLDTGTSAGYAVVPVLTGSSLKAAQWANALFEEGINVQPVFYPAVEEKAARLRFFICATHEPQQISQTVAALARLARGA